MLLGGHSCSGLGLQVVHGAFSLSLGIIAAWFVWGHALLKALSQQIVAMGKVSKLSSIWEDKWERASLQRLYRSISPNPVWHRRTIKVCSWTTGKWRLLKWRTVETFVTSLATERFWDKKWNWVVSPQARCPRRKQDRWLKNFYTNRCSMETNRRNKKFEHLQSFTFIEITKKW